MGHMEMTLGGSNSVAATLGTGYVLPIFDVYSMEEEVRKFVVENWRAGRACVDDRRHVNRAQTLDIQLVRASPSTTLTRL